MLSILVLGQPSKISAESNEGDSVQASVILNEIAEVDNQWVIEANFNYSSQLNTGTIVTNYPELQFDIEAPNLADTIDVTVEFFLNDMRADSRQMTVSSFTDLPDLFMKN